MANNQKGNWRAEVCLTDGPTYFFIVDGDESSIYRDEHGTLSVQPGPGRVCAIFERGSWVSAVVVGRKMDPIDVGGGDGLGKNRPMRLGTLRRVCGSLGKKVRRSLRMVR